MNTSQSAQKYDLLEAVGYTLLKLPNIITVFNNQGAIIMTLYENFFIYNKEGKLYKVRNWVEMSFDEFKDKLIECGVLPDEKLHEAHALHLTNNLS